MGNKVNANDLVTLFVKAYDEKWGYIWGTHGQTWTEADQRAEENKDSPREMTVKYGRNWIGKRVADCSGLFYWAFKELGGYIYHGSNTIWKKYCTENKGVISKDTELKPGMAVFLTKDGNRHHMGLYIGNGEIIESKGTATGVVKSHISHWNEYAELLDADYYGLTTSYIPPKTVRKGDINDTVKELQEKLNFLGFKLQVDGNFGSMTYGAVATFQDFHGLDVDGVVGPKTWKAIEDELSLCETIKNEISEADKTVEEQCEHKEYTLEEKVNILWNNFIQNEF